MKFGSVWRSTVEGMPPALREACLDYKKYKRLSKDLALPTPAIQATLERDLGRTATVFQRHLAGLRKPPSSSSRSLFSVFEACKRASVASCPPDTGIGSQQVHHFATFNTTTLYKICKRLDKRHATSWFTPWFRKAIEDRTIPFVNKKEHSYLALHAHIELPDAEECPVCFDDPTRDGLVLDCGHLICTKCILNMLDVHKTRGTLHNLVSHGAYYHPKLAKCPVCRDARALTRYTHVVDGSV
jgi:hypothetical protein